MKIHNIKLTAFTITVLFTLFSCKKIHKCRCSDNSHSNASQDFSIGHSSKKDAKEACKAFEKDLNEKQANVSCKIVS